LNERIEKTNHSPIIKESTFFAEQSLSRD